MVVARVLDPASISVRETEVLAALGQHLTNSEIAARLFISVRTVESHVSSLLRKLRADDRRALAALAADLPTRDGAQFGPAASASHGLPSSLTPFVGRTAERSALAAAVHEHRLVTAVGPGGVGKTRLALAVAAQVSDQFADGAWYVDLVPVADAVRIAAAIADAVGLGDRPGTSVLDSVSSWFAARQTLLVLDNCEHLLDGVVVLVERLLAGCPALTVLATSRARLLVPFERVFAVPGLSIEADDGGPGDAVELFLGRAAAGGAAIDARDTARVAGICRALDGMALAIELAAARYASLGMDGLEAGLSDRLRVLSGRPRVDDRHQSLRSALDWSYALLDGQAQAAMRRVSVFAEPFTVTAAAELVAAWAPLDGVGLVAILADLAEHSLLVTVTRTGGTRYRMLETIRQYGIEQLEFHRELDNVRARHLSWCLAQSEVLGIASRADADAWRAHFDDVVDELRAALAWASRVDACRADAHRLAIVLGELCFLRGMPAESQWRYEQAASLAPDDATEAQALRLAAGAAQSRHFGDDALQLWLRAAQAAVRAGDDIQAAVDVAHGAELIYRMRGLMATAHPASEAEALLARSRELVGDDPAVPARLLCAEAFAAGVDNSGGAQLAERAVLAARRAGDRLTESAALDHLATVALVRGDVGAAATTARQRIDVLASVPVDATSGLELFDGFRVASECAIAAGDLLAGWSFAKRSADLPFYQEQGHIASAQLIVAAVLIGDLVSAVALGERFREGWERAGRCRAGNLTRGAYAAATAHGLRGDDDSRAEWLRIVRALETPDLPLARVRFVGFFDALLWLHRGRPDLAAEALCAPPDDQFAPDSGTWRPWYGAAWAETAVLTQSADAADRVARARPAVSGNPVAEAMLARAASLSAPGDGRGELPAVAAALHDAGCRYQWARTLVIMGGAERVRGEAALAEMGAAPMIWPLRRP